MANETKVRPDIKRARRRCLRLSDIDWSTYTKLLRAFTEKPGVRLAYDCGELEIMSPLLEHDDDTWFLAALVIALTQEWGLPIKRGGATTLRRRLKRRGIEPDAAFWIANARAMAGVRRLNLRKHPPPDLAIEVDVTSSSLNRLAIYAALAIPEVWRWNDGVLTFFVLVDGAYEEAETSRSFHGIRPTDLTPFLQRARLTEDENEVEREFREWARERKPTV